jgi:uncharacterized protein (DUF2147 family)
VIRILIGGLLALALSPVLWAQEMTPVGVWKSIDDETGRERSIIRISEVDGRLQGVVEKIFDQPGDDPAHLCKKCDGPRKDQPIVGMTILTGLKKQGDEWSGGEILDPKKGKTYRCKMRLSDDGAALDVRGYIGISLIGRTQTWLRVQ